MCLKKQVERYTVNSRYNQVGYNELFGYKEVYVCPHVALLTEESPSGILVQPEKDFLNPKLNQISALFRTPKSKKMSVHFTVKANDFSNNETNRGPEGFVIAGAHCITLSMLVSLNLRMTSELRAKRSSRGSVSDTASLPCPSPASSTAGVSCTLCGTKDSLVWLPQVDATSVNQSDQFVLCASCTAAQHPFTHNTRQSSFKRHRDPSASTTTNSSPAKKKEKVVPTSSTSTQPISEPAPPPEPTSSNPFRKPRKGKPSRVYMQPATTVCERVFCDGIRFEPGDIVSLIDRDNQGIYFAMIRGLISDIEANKFAFLTWLLPLEPVHVKSLAKPNFQPSKYCMGPHDYNPTRVNCLRFECSSPLSPSYRYPKSKIDSPFL